MTGSTAEGDRGGVADAAVRPLLHQEVGFPDSTRAPQDVDRREDSVLVAEIHRAVEAWENDDSATAAVSAGRRLVRDDASYW